MDNNTISINAVDDLAFGEYNPTLDDVRGITFYVSKPVVPIVELRDRRLQDEDLVWNVHDGIAYSVSIWPYFTYP